MASAPLRNVYFRFFLGLIVHNMHMKVSINGGLYISNPAVFLLLWLGSDLKATKYCSEARFLHVNYWRDLLLGVGLCG